jgi:plasmid stability protein
MATLNVKNFPDHIYRRLQERARQNRRSVSQEVVHLLEEAVAESPRLSLLELEGLGKELWEKALPPKDATPRVPLQGARLGDPSVAERVDEPLDGFGE